MANDADRPRPRTTAIPVEERREVLWDLLTIERERLREAVRIEAERRIVFPETTVIIKDIEHILDALGGGDDDTVEQTASTKLQGGRTWRVKE